MRPQQEPVVAKQLSVELGDDTVTPLVDLRITGGTITLITGATGTGKSELLATLAGLKDPVSGDLTVLGGAAAEKTSKIGVHYEEPTVFPNLTALDNARFVAHGGNTTDLRGLLERLDIGEDLQLVKGKSLNYQQRRLVLLAGLFAREADLLLMDEPTKGLDADTAAIVAQLVGEAKAAGRTIVITMEHADPAFAALADSHAEMSGQSISIVPDSSQLEHHSTGA